ncbi:DUF2478 domain-containing protein [Castellaniella sp. GW247-6E4]|uniref:DUF2478 domain-containing protein n=1 Tax=Castellaniella sp. GW247-6E4 TaxID=3140380 RepID=UPI0033149A80
MTTHPEPGPVPFHGAELPIAALVHAHGDEADAVVRDFVALQIQRGLDVRGLVMLRDPARRGKQQRCLQDVRSGETFEIFQDLGKGSRACCLDISALVAAGAVLRTAAQARPDLVVIDRYGRQEAEGGGFSAEFLALMTEGIPLLTIVADEFVDAWRGFTGALGAELPVDADRLREWGAATCMSSRA